MIQRLDTNRNYQATLGKTKSAAQSLLAKALNDLCYLRTTYIACKQRETDLLLRNTKLTLEIVRLKTRGRN